MDKVKNFLKSHNLEVELLNDKTFVEESKKIFEEQGLEFSKEQLKEIIGDVSDNLEDVKELPQTELESIVGGVNKEENTPKMVAENPSSTARIAIQATGLVLGVLVGGGIGLGLSTEFKYDNKEHKLESTKFKTFPTVIGAGAGSVVGFKLGKLIADKYKL